MTIGAVLAHSDGWQKRYQASSQLVGLARNIMQLLKRIDVWRAPSPSRAICYNCVENLQTGRFRVCTADFVECGAARNANQERYFVEQIADWLPDDPERPKWFETLEAAIAAHDADFEN